VVNQLSGVGYLLLACDQRVRHTTEAFWGNDAQMSRKFVPAEFGIHSTSARTHAAGQRSELNVTGYLSRYPALLTAEYS
jgi:hypothetical protein